MSARRCVVRAARWTDVPALAALSQDKEDGDGFSAAMLQASAPVVAPTAAQLWLRVGEVDGRVVAMLHLQVVAGMADVVDLVVHPRWRGQGIGRAVLAACLAELRAHAVGACGLEVARGNVAARRLYARLGFVQVGLRRAYYAAARLQGTPAEGAMDVGAAYTDALVLTKTV